MAEKKKKTTKKKPTKKTAKKKIVPKKVERYYDKPRRFWTEEDWKEWGEDFGKRWEEWGDDFGKRWEDRGRRFEIWWLRSFGLVGPLIGSIVGIVFLAIGMWLLNLANLILLSTFVTNITNFVLSNIHWFFAIFLFSNYSEYLEKRYPKPYWTIAPIMTSTKIIIGLWIFAALLNIINYSVNISILVTISSFIMTNLAAVFMVFLVLGYVMLIIGFSWFRNWWGSPPPPIC